MTTIDLMCSHPNCPSKGHCARHNASGTQRRPFQKYQEFPPNVEGECSGLIRTRPRVPVKAAA